jgi:8-hydroxy-5-deazaflavin:NADPH oxidoreductase
VKIGILGTGSVGQALAGKLVELGHEVRMGARDAGNEKAKKWAESAGPRASSGDFRDAAAFGEIVIHACRGEGAHETLTAAGRENLAGKVLWDVANPLDFSKGMPPTLFTGAAQDSLAERIQKAHPEARLVKALNMVNASVMVDPARTGGDSDLFIAGNDAKAKETVVSLLRELGWKSIVDLGDVTAARGMESYLLLWLRLWGVLGTPDFNIRIVRKA